MGVWSAWGGALRARGLWWPALVVGIYLALVLLGITNSSLAVLDDASDGTQGLIAGQPRPIRSDEWIKATPQLIGQLASGSSSFMPTLAAPVENGGTTAAGPVSALLNAESMAGGVLARWNLDSGLAAVWWFPALLFALGLPSLLKRFGVSTPLGVAAVVAITFSPANAWWSWWPLRASAFACVAAAAAAAAVAALSDPSRRHHRLVGAAWIAVAGLMLARLALSYAPWVVTIGAPILSATAAWLIWRRATWRVGLVVVAVSAVIGVALTAGYLFENRDFYQALAGTIYPAARQVKGQFIGLSLLFGAPQLWYLQTAHPPVTASNASELSSAYTILVLPVLAGLSVFLRTAATGARRLPRHALALGGPVAILLLWCTVNFPQEAMQLPVLSRVPADRVAQGIGIPLTIMAVLALAGMQRRGDAKAVGGLGIAVGVATFAVLAPSASSLQTAHLPTLPTWSIWLVSSAWAAGLGLVVAKPRSAWALAPLGVLMVATTVFVNPAQQGTADLRTSAAAQALDRLTDQLQPGDRVAASDMWAGAVLMANEVPLLNGYQGAPSQESWSALDPSGEFKDAWNRGASLVQIEWQPAGQEVSIVTPQKDVVTLRADPCDPVLDELEVGAIVARADLGPRECLVPMGAVVMAGQPEWLYLRSGS